MLVACFGVRFYNTNSIVKFLKVSFLTCCNENVAPIPEREFLPDRAPNGQPNWQLTGSFLLKNH